MSRLARGAALAALVSIVTLGFTAGVSAAPPKSGGSGTTSALQTLLIYNQQTGTFPSLTAGPNERIVVTEVNVGVLVPIGTAPTGSIWVAPRDPANTGWAGAYSASLPLTMTSNFQNAQDRYAASRTTSIVLEPGQSLTWYLSERDGENAFSPANSIAASLSVRGEIVTVN